ncbi:DUF47 domain-containing protein [Methylotetracoccus oryzae]|uniref:DUF47 domain-containing protein n=1 Tax=Methylotetracoccus oryzae TaxID=1919059 RepID=UPI001119A711|nr:DUF47 domain-containing protein [Methylotetracoccus oryzae]
MQHDYSTLSPADALRRIFRDQVDNITDCGHALSQVFLHLPEPETYIAEVKRLEEIGDRLTAAAYQALQAEPYSELTHITEQFVRHLDDIADGINDTARSIDICRPKRAEPAGHELLATLLSMITRLHEEVALYPENTLDRLRTCRETLKRLEETADTLYHEWRKTQRRLSSLPLVDENNWTEILGTLEQTTDAAYHAVLSLEHIAKRRPRSAG